MKLELSPKQTTAMTPQLIQAIEVLQMSSQELLEHISEALEENPVLEQEDKAEASEKAVIYGEFSAAASSRFHGGERSNGDGGIPERASEFDESLFDSLRSQIEGLGLPLKTRKAVLLLAESLNGSGWLDENLEDISLSSGCPQEILENALELLQSLEPAGVGARSLEECLYLQLERYYPDEILAMEIAENYLPAVSKAQYGLIASRTGAAKVCVREACDLIRSLSPRPGSAFGSDGGSAYIVPDVIVSQQGRHFEVRLNERFSPDLGISAYYSALARTSEDPEVRRYLGEKLRQAKWLISAVEQRRQTLCRCVACLLKIQEDFFTGKSAAPAPMSLSDIAVELDVHESTVSRALKGKYIQCAGGCYPLNHFLSRSFATADGTNSVSPDMVKSMLRDMIQSEDKSRPLSDQKLCQRLNEKGCAISRRTVAKYRDEMNIPGASGRKKPDSL